MDLYLFQLINQFALRFAWLDSLGIFFAGYFEFVLLFALLVFLAVRFQKYWKMVAGAILSAVLTRLVIVNIIRWIWHRPRPFVEHNVNLLLQHADEGAFPSGHAAFYFAIATIVFLYNKKAGILFFIASFLISLGRVFVGIHWPTDILAGAAVGILSGLLVYKLSKKYLLNFS